MKDPADHKPDISETTALKERVNSANITMQLSIDKTRLLFEHLCCGRKYLKELIDIFGYYNKLV